MSPTATATPTTTATTATTALTPAAAFDQLPLSFERNQGQVPDPTVRYLVRGAGYTLYLRATDATLRVQPPPPPPPDPALRGTGAGNGLPLAATTPLTGAVIRLRYQGADPSAVLSGDTPLPGVVNDFRGADPAAWVTSIPTYSRVAESNVYPGINLVFYGQQHALEYDWHVAPGANVGAIQLAVDGAQGLSLDGQGNLLIQTAAGTLEQRAPRAYQIIAGQQQTVPTQYVLSGPAQVGLAVGAYDPTQPLTIDPVFYYGTYLGGSNDDVAYGIAVDSSGAAYVTGATASSDFITTTGAYTYAGNDDAFVAKLNPQGTALVYSTYVGGRGYDVAQAIALDGSGAAYLTGQTSSTDFPITPTNAAQTSMANTGVAFVSKLTAGGVLAYSTFLGGTTAPDSGYGLAVDGSGRAFVVGGAQSHDFPTTSGAYAPTWPGGSEAAFLTEVNASGTAFLYSSYLGGHGADLASSVVLDGAGHAYLGGQSTSTDFPTTAGAYQRTNAGGADAFVAELTPANGGSSDLLASTLLGGSSDDYGESLARDSSGALYLTGQTGSSSFPTQSGLPTTFTGQSDVFVAKFPATLGSLVYSSIVGGHGSQIGEGIAVDASGNAYVAGRTTATDFPTSPTALQGRAGGGQDAFVVKLSASGNALLYSTYLGGLADDATFAIAVGSQGAGDGAAYVAGESAAGDFPTAGLQPLKAGGYDAVVAKVPTVPQSGLSWTTLHATLPISVQEAAVTTGHDGAIYVIGGVDSSGADVATTRVYYPLTQTWTTAPALPTALHGAQAVTLPNGNVMVLGGASGCNNFQVCSAVYSAAYAYTPGASGWVALHAMSTARFLPAAALFNGQVYVVGGWTGSAALSSIERYDPGTDTWSAAGTLPSAPVIEAAAAVVDGQGRLDVLGGFNGVTGSGCQAYTSMYTTADGTTWSTGPALLTARAGPGAVLGPDGQLYTLGGFSEQYGCNNAGGFVPTVEVYNPTTMAWSTSTPLPSGVCCNGTLATADGTLYVFGGNSRAGSTQQVVEGSLVSALNGRLPWHPHQSVRLNDHLSATVDLADGHVDVSANDLSIPARGPDLTVDHTWDSAQAQQNPATLATTAAGQGWFSDLTPSMGRTGASGVGRSAGLTDTVTYTDSSGTAWAFPYTGTITATATAPYTAYHSPPGQPWSLITAPSGSTGYTLTNILSGAVLRFDTQGRLQSNTDAYSNTNSLTWGSSGPTQEANSGGRTLAATYNGAGLLAEVQSPLWQSGGATAAGSQHVTYGYTNTTSLSSLTWGAGTANAQAATFGYQGQQLITLTTPYTTASAPPYPHTWTLGYDLFGRVSTITSPISGTPGQAGYTPSYVTQVRYTPGMTQTVVVEGYGTTGALTQTYTLDVQGRATQVRDARNDSATTSYDATHDVLSRTDANGHVTTNAYADVGPTGSTGLLTQTVAPPIQPYTFTNSLIAPTTTYSYDPTTHDLLKVTSPNGGETRYAYDGHHSIITTTVETDNSPCNAPCVRTYNWRASVTQYDGYGERIAQTDGRGFAVSSDYTATVTPVTPVTPTTPGANTRTWRYYPTGDLLASSTPPLTTTLSGVVSAAVPVTTSYGYNGDGLLTGTLAPNGPTTYDGYDHLGRPVYTVSPPITLYNSTVVSPTAYTFYDGDGNVVYQQDANGDATKSSYDPQGRLTLATNPISGTTAYTYNASEQTAVQDPQGNVSTSQYDAAGRLTQQTDPTGGVTQYGYDPVGNTTGITLGDGTIVTQTQSMTYDAANAVVSATVAGPSGVSPETTQSTYDLNGNTIQVEQPITTAGTTNAVTYNSYDFADQLRSSEIDAAPVTGPTHTTQQIFNYDTAGNQTDAYDYDNRHTVTSYDGDNRIVQTVATTNTASISTTNGYDPNGNTLTQTVQTVDTSAPGLSQTHTYTAAYNADDWTSSSGDDGLVLSYGYDATGQERSRSGGGSTIGTALNAEGLITQTTESTAGTGPYTDTFGYTTNDLLNSVTMGDPIQQSIAYNGANQVTSVNTTGVSGVAASAFGYNSIGQTTQVTALSGTDTLTYYSNGRLQSESGPNVLPSIASHTYQWSYDPSGNVTTATADNGNTATYNYAPNNELTSSTAPMDPTTTYYYDGSGNTTGITTTTTTPLTSSFAISTNVGYDSQGRPSVLVHKDGTYSTNSSVVFDTITLAYNALGQRSAYTVTTPGEPGLVMHFQYDDGGQLYQDTVLSGTVQGSSIVTTTYTDTYLYRPDGLPLELVRQSGGSTSRYWYELDGQGSVIALTDVTDHVVDSYAYDLWGEPLPGLTKQTVMQQFRYQGYWLDDATGWYWMIDGRQYDPEAMRFMQPAIVMGNLNYVYADDDPVATAGMASSTGGTGPHAVVGIVGPATGGPQPCDPGDPEQICNDPHLIAYVKSVASGETPELPRPEWTPENFVFRRPEYVNPGTHVPGSSTYVAGKTPLPADALEVYYETAIPSPLGSRKPAKLEFKTWYGISQTGDIYRYDGIHYNGERWLDVHFNGSKYSVLGLKEIPNGIESYFKQLQKNPNWQAYFRPKGKR